MDLDDIRYSASNVGLREQIEQQQQRIRELETLCAYWRDGYSSQSVYNSGREEVFLKRISELEAENERLNLEKGMAIMEAEGIKVANGLMKEKMLYWKKRFMETDTKLSRALEQKP